MTEEQLWTFFAWVCVAIITVTGTMVIFAASWVVMTLVAAIATAGGAELEGPHNDW